MIPKEHKERAYELIRSGKNFKETSEILKNEGIEISSFNSAFYKWRSDIFPDDKIDEGLETAREKRSERKPKKKLVTWTKQKQKTADESKLAELINKGLFTFIPCPSGKLEEKDIQDINVGGAVVGSLMYFLPDFNLDHPVIILVTRAILLVIKVRALCFKIKEKIEETKAKIADGITGIKEDFR